MKENLLDVLMYLLQNVAYQFDDQEEDTESLTSALQEAGFADNDIHEAFNWLDDLETRISQHNIVQYPATSNRFFSREEQNILDYECRNYLISLVNSGILSTATLEIVVDRVFSLTEHSFSLDHLEWLVLLVLSCQSNEQAAFERFEAMIFSDSRQQLH